MSRKLFFDRAFRSLCVGILLASSTSLGAVDFSNPNTWFFSISDFYYQQDLSAKPFSASGFYIPATGKNKARVSMLPHVSLNVSAAKFLNEDGISIEPENIDRDTVLSEVIIPITYVRTLPNEIEGTAIASQVIEGVKLEAFMPEPVSQAPGIPALDRYGSGFPDVHAAVMSSIYEYRRKLEPQKIAKQKWQDINARLAEMDSLEINLKISGETVATRKLTGSAIIAGSTLPPLTIIEPSLRTANKIRQGNYDVEIGYIFRDTNTGSVRVTQDYAMTMDNYIEETRRVITKSRSSGWSIFNIGSRRTSATQKIKESARYDSTYDQKTNTNIVIEDADDNLFKYFEDQFFPTLTKQETISSHLDAAQLASQSGNEALAKAHRDYAAALQASDESSELDAVGAAAALSSGNYAMFLAKGVRFKDTASSQSSSFSRVISQKVNEGIEKDWTAVNMRSAYRKITTVLLPEVNDVKYRAYDGSCGLNIYKGMYQRNPSYPYLIPTCVMEGSPLHAAGIVSGSFIASVDSQKIDSPKEYIDIVKSHDPGDELIYEMLEISNYGPQFVTKRVTLAKGAKR